MMNEKDIEYLILNNKDIIDFKDFKIIKDPMNNYSCNLSMSDTVDVLYTNTDVITLSIIFSFNKIEEIDNILFNKNLPLKPFKSLLYPTLNKLLKEIIKLKQILKDEENDFTYFLHFSFNKNYELKGIESKLCYLIHNKIFDYSFSYSFEENSISDIILNCYVLFDLILTEKIKPNDISFIEIFKTFFIFKTEILGNTIDFPISNITIDNYIDYLYLIELTEY